MQTSQSYPTDLSDEQWNIIQRMLPQRKTLGRPPNDPRIVMNAILYETRAGGAWRMLPKTFPPWQSIYGCFRRWEIAGLWQHLHTFLVTLVRFEADRESNPTAGIMDSQSAKAPEGGEAIGYDAGKHVKGRKRHILVDTLGLIQKVMVMSASIQDREGAKVLLEDLKHSFCRLRKIWADGGYSGDLEQWVKDIRSRQRLSLDIVKRDPNSVGFHVLPKRWIVERTFAWLMKCRRLRCDYERCVKNSVAMIHIAMISVMLRRLA